MVEKSFHILYLGICDLPDPIMDEDGHYKSFDELYSTSTTEKDLIAIVKVNPEKEWHTF